MFRTYLSPHNLIVSVILFAACSVLAYAASVVGIDDNPPGIALAYLAAMVLVLVFVHPVRTSKHFRYIMVASAIGFVLFGVFHALVEAVAPSLGAALFLFAVLVCPSALLVAAIGAVLISRGERLMKEGSSAA